MFLTRDKLKLFERDGFLVLEDFVSIEYCESLRKRAIEIVEKFNSTKFNRSEKYFFTEQS